MLQDPVWVGYRNQRFGKLGRNYDTSSQINPVFLCCHLTKIQIKPFSTLNYSSQGLLPAPSWIPHTHCSITLGVQGTRGFIQHQDLRVTDQGPGNGQPLLLPDGELAPLLPHLCKKASKKDRGDQK